MFSMVFGELNQMKLPAELDILTATSKFYLTHLVNGTTSYLLNKLDNSAHENFTFFSVFFDVHSEVQRPVNSNK